MRLKVRNRVFRSAGLALTYFAAAALVFYGCFAAARLAAPLLSSNPFSFRVKSLSVHGPDEVISAEISRRLGDRLGSVFSSGDADLFAAGLKKTYPALSRVVVGRNFFTGRVDVRAEAENVVARVRVDGGDVLYLSENGRLLREYCGPAPVDAFETDVYAVPPAGLGPFAGFLKELKAGLPVFLSRPVRLVYGVPAARRGRPGRGTLSAPAKGPAARKTTAEESSGGARYCRLTLENSAQVLWGELEFTKSKIARLNEVLGDAAGRINGPLRIDLRYFRDGKVFVSKSTDI